MPTYHAFGLTVASELDLPELPAGAEPAVPDVRIRRDAVPGALPAPQASGVFFQAAPEHFLLRVRQSRILVRCGSEIRVDTPGGNEDQLRVFLLGACFGALLHQRGLLVLHASGIQGPRGAVLFAGPSGAGKSTLLGALLQRGHAMVSDDLAAVTADLRVQPGIPRVRLWPDSVRGLGLRVEDHPAEQPDLAKVVLAPPRLASGPVPLHRIYFLEDDGPVPDIRLEPLDPMGAFRSLLRHTYRPRYLGGLGTRDRHFALASAAAGQVAMVRVLRPRSRFLVQELADRVERDFDP